MWSGGGGDGDVVVSGEVDTAEEEVAADLVVVVRGVRLRWERR